MGLDILRSNGTVRNAVPACIASHAERRAMSRARRAAVWGLVWGSCLWPLVASAQTRLPPKGKKPVAVGTPHDNHTDYRSQRFWLHTDLSAEEATELLERLETMCDLISAYWGRPSRDVIECYVVKDLAKWPSGSLPDENGRASIAGRAGVTFTSSRTGPGGFVAKSVVYAVADHGVPQHEAVHAYCGQTFGTTGPLWYSEGMAEMGQYWRKGDSSVNLDPRVAEYLRTTPIKSLNQIVNGRERTGDSWQNYAWRWALCHLLANNPNYSAKFRPLGLALLNQEDTSFEKVYGEVSDQISFEYRFFIENLDVGYRVDLCSWDWKKKFVPLTVGASVNARVLADHGWQAAQVLLSEGKAYDYKATGTWKTSKDGAALTANGDDGGNGMLLAVVMKDFQLGKPFELGESGSFTADGDGQLYLRCRDKWNELADNKGQIAVRLQFKKE